MNRALRAATIGVLLLTPVALSACSAGQITQTATQQRDKYGAQALIGDLVIRDAALAFPGPQGYAAGDDAELTMVVANPALNSDRLISITGSDFQGVRVTNTGPVVVGGSSAGQGVDCVPLTGVTGSPTFAAGGAAEGSGPAPIGSTAGATTSAGTTTSAKATGTGSGLVSTGSIPPRASVAGQSIPTVLNSTSPLTTAPGSAGRIAVPIPANCDVAPGFNLPRIFLTNLTRPLSTAAIVPVTMTFQRAGTVTVPFIVSPPNYVLPRTSTYDFNQGGPGGGLNENKAQEGAAHGGQ